VARPLRSGDKFSRYFEGHFHSPGRADCAKGISQGHGQLLSILRSRSQDADRTWGYLTQRAIDKAFVVGLATDFCVAWTAIDARSIGLETYVVEDACRGIDTGGFLAAAWAAMDKAGVRRITSEDLAV
jgi:nicotinamidase/pyrazinamidase